MFVYGTFGLGESVSSTIALIPARGGSKRLPRKNILDFMGKPMIAYTIEAALESGCFDQVVVSTEDDEIASVAESYGALVDQRQSDLASDAATVAEVCLEFLKRNPVEILSVLYPTAPLRTAVDIRSVVDLLGEDCGFAMAATLCEWPVHQTLRINDGVVSPLFPDWVNQRSDQFGDCCIDNGSTYAVRVDEFSEQKTFYGKSLRAYLMPTSRSIDVDTQDDFNRAAYEAQRLMQ